MKAFFVPVLLAGLAGCSSTAEVLKEDSEAVVKLIDASLTTTRHYYDNLGQQQFDYMIEFLAARPSCNAESPLLYKADESRCLTSDEKLLWRDCQASEADACTEWKKIRPASFSPQANQRRQTMVSLIATVANYQQALANILEDETFDTASDLKDLNSRLNELKNQIDELKGDTSAEDEAKEELEKQLGAVGTLIDLVRNAEQDQADFAKLKKLVTTKAPAVDVALESLLSSYEKVDKPMSDNFARRRTEITRNTYNRMPLDERLELSQEEREDILRGIYEPESQRLSNASRPDSLAAGLRGLIRSHKTLQAGFAGNLTKEQRARIAKKNKQQVKAAFKAMLNIVKLFN
ncbi:MAG: hypothetical protein K0U72_12080 [Gammaproteobacteria bacterium]|nr:hypothetical protein [Gammaproteobacteria bacterium]